MKKAPRNFGNWFYSPRLGRFINRDPIGEAGRINLYSYVGNNPVNNIDRYELWTATGGGEFGVNLGPIHGSLGWQAGIGHDPCQPWYKGWSGSPFLLSAGGGLGAGLGGSATGFVQFTDAQSINDLTGEGRETGISGGEGIVGGASIVQGGWNDKPTSKGDCGCNISGNPYIGNKFSGGLGIGAPAEVHHDWSLTGGPVWEQGKGWH